MKQPIFWTRYLEGVVGSLTIVFSSLIVATAVTNYWNWFFATLWLVILVFCLFSLLTDSVVGLGQAILDTSASVALRVGTWWKKVRAEEKQLLFKKEIDLDRKTRFWDEQLAIDQIRCQFAKDVLTDPEQLLKDLTYLLDEYCWCARAPEPPGNNLCRVCQEVVKLRERVLNVVVVERQT